MALALEKFAYNRAKAIIALALGRDGLLMMGMIQIVLGIPNASDVVMTANILEMKRIALGSVPVAGRWQTFRLYGYICHVNDLHFMVDLAAECHLLNQHIGLCDYDGACHGEVIAYAEEGVLNVSVFFRRPAKIDAFKWLANSDGVLFTRAQNCLGRLCSNKLFDSFGLESLLLQISLVREQSC